MRATLAGLSHGLVRTLGAATATYWVYLLVC